MRKRIRYLAQGIYTLEVTTNQLVSFDYDVPFTSCRDADDDEEEDDEGAKKCFKIAQNLIMKS